ncbi:family 78 glycoside hydrolase catalytic domain [Parabacteroides sp. AM08-6]|uniref:family 78 glycoside hydrolase catalytic domain n=1 Tax=Parabacteroides sp. AM08-6 TaxID=2292053 RepID=UPI000EFFC394|nr:family 78 glycoside hydrolase catalytic domain [Parabacteroides sp. AM08-6]RHJ84774.1 alpha-L-rhamnosidase [Parabacteroides sp. AM08-6]
MNNRLISICFLLVLLPFLLQAESKHTVYNLLCEQEENPLGIETKEPRFSWQIQAQTRNFEQSAWQILVADSPEKLQAENGNIWDSGKNLSSTSILVPFKGKELKAGQVYYWKVKTWDKEGNPSPWSMINRFGMGLLSEKDWNNAKWIALEKDKKDEIITTGLHGLANVDRELKGKKIGLYHMPQFRKEFTVQKPIKRAIAYVSGLGHFDMFLNGDKIGNHFLDPGWTKYDKCALYISFDISDQLKQGQNVIGVMLGNGFFNIPRERYFKLLASYGAPRLLMKLQIDYTDGSTQNIVTDTDWKATESPVTYSSIYGGEDYDANKEQDGWMEPGFDTRSWNKALNTGWKTRLISQRSAPLIVRDPIPTVRLFKTRQGQWVYDLGQNFSGIVRLSLNAKDKQPVKLYPAELLNPDSTVNQSASGAPYWFSYTPKGKGTESWQPQFTYYGFRYVQVEGAVPAGQPNPDGLPEITEITGLHTCNSAENVGRFHCSKPLFNQTYELIDWAIRSNMASVLTDCPHREKLGWLEQTHLMQYSVQYRYNLARMYEKIFNDIRSTQAANGMVPAIAPELVEFEGGFKDTPEWGSTFIISPWYIYQWYGDTRLIETYYPDMQRYIDYLSSKANNHIIAYGLGDWFDIGPNSPGEAQLTSNGVTATAIYYYDVTLMEKMANLLGKQEDARKYGELATKIKEAFNQTFWEPSTQKYERNSQAANAVALYMGLTTPENKQKVFDNLVADIRGRNNALTAGDVGYRYVLRALEAGGASDVIYDMNCKYDTPGYGWQLAHGATALTESWQAYGFISNNHFMLGHLMEWLFSGLGGIRQQDDSFGFKHIVIKPEPVGDVREAEASYQSPYGLIVSDWKDNEKEFIVRVEVPANSRASVYLPAKNTEQITESGIPLKDVSGISYKKETDKYTVATIGSGTYLFKVSKE